MVTTCMADFMASRRAGRNAHCVAVNGVFMALTGWHTPLLARCGGVRSEDLVHFVLECPACDHIRDRDAVLFEFLANMSAATCMPKPSGLFGCNK